MEIIAKSDAQLRLYIEEIPTARLYVRTNLAEYAYFAARFCHFDPELTQQTFPHLCEACHFIGVAHPDKVFQVFVADHGPVFIDVLFQSDDPRKQDGLGLDGYLFEGDLVAQACCFEIKTMNGRFYLLVTFFPRQLAEESYARRCVDTYLIRKKRVDLIRSDEYKLGEVTPYKTTHPNPRALPQPPESDFVPYD